MLEFEAFYKKHGETVTQHILDVWERREGRQPSVIASLEERWDAFLQATASVAA